MSSTSHACCVKWHVFTCPDLPVTVNHALLKRNSTNSWKQGPSLWGNYYDWHILSHFLFSYSTVGLILLFSQYLSNVDVPMVSYKNKKWMVFQYPLFKLFSVSCQNFQVHVSLAFRCDKKDQIKWWDPKKTVSTILTLLHKKFNEK